MITRATVQRTPGFFLIEYLVYIAVLSVVLGVAFSGFYKFLGNSRDLARNSEDILQALAAGEMWRADIRSASVPPEIRTGPDYVALEITKKEGLVAYIVNGQSLWRRAGEAPPKAILTKVAQSRMVRDPRSKTVAWRWDLEISTKKKNVRVRPLFTFLAVEGQP